MLRDEKNIKDENENFGIALKDTTIHISYDKTDKLVTALYMVTDILEKDEPIKYKLRTLGTNILSDIYNGPRSAMPKISEVMSFLDIASAMHIISEMNCRILRKEFLELNKAIEESLQEIKTIDTSIDLSGFFDREPSSFSYSLPRQYTSSSREDLGNNKPTKLGIQKGGTLMKALSDRILKNRNQLSMSDKKSKVQSNSMDNALLKGQRRKAILNIIKITGPKIAIKDIKDKIVQEPEKAGLLVACSEKTLQRELVSMVRDGVLSKEGEKRWSRYSIKNRR